MHMVIIFLPKVALIELSSNIFYEFILFLVSYRVLFLFSQFVYIVTTGDNQTIVLADVRTLYLVTPVLS